MFFDTAEKSMKVYKNEKLERYYLEYKLFPIVGNGIRHQISEEIKNWLVLKSLAPAALDVIRE